MDEHFIEAAAAGLGQHAFGVKHQHRQHRTVAPRPAAPALGLDQFLDQADAAVQLGHRIELRGRCLFGPHPAFVPVALPQHHADHRGAQGCAQGKQGLQAGANARQPHGQRVQADQRRQHQQAAHGNAQREPVAQQPAAQAEPEHQHGVGQAQGRGSGKLLTGGQGQAGQAQHRGDQRGNLQADRHETVALMGRQPAPDPEVAQCAAQRPDQHLRHVQGRRRQRGRHFAQHAAEQQHEQQGAQVVDQPLRRAGAAHLHQVGQAHGHHGADRAHRHAPDHQLQRAHRAPFV
jgi:hypothetical protein